MRLFYIQTGSVWRVLAVLLKSAGVYVLALLANFRWIKLLKNVLGYTALKLSWGRNKRIPAFYPVYASIEPTPYCNLRCPECPSGLRRLDRGWGMLDKKTYIRFLRGVQKYTVYLNFYVLGEPTLHPDLPWMIALARKAGMYTALSTNGHFLTPKNIRRLLMSGLNRMIISLDGYSQDAYGKYRVGGNVQRVLRGVETVVRLRDEMGLNQPLVIVQTLPFGFNQHELGMIRRWCENTGVDFFLIKPARIELQDPQSVCPTFPELKRVVKMPRPNSCWRVCSTLVCTWNGMFLLCCYDHEGRYTMGGIGYNSGSGFAWFNTRAYYLMRKRIFSERARLQLCAGCPES